jgi:hypothetical protein
MPIKRVRYEENGRKIIKMKGIKKERGAITLRPDLCKPKRLKCKRLQNEHKPALRTPFCIIYSYLNPVYTVYILFHAVATQNTKTMCDETIGFYLLDT